MEVSINELSFKGQFASIEEARSCIRNIASSSFASKKLTGNSPVRRTKALEKRPFIGGKTIEEFKIELFQSKRPEDSQLLTQLLVSVVQGPFIDDSELNPDLAEAKSICKEPVGGTALHAYLSKGDESIHALISADKSGFYDCPMIELTYQGNKITVLNFLSDTCCQSYVRVYEANPKHAIQKDKIVAGKQHSKMDLSDTLAQECLDLGFQVLGGKYVYYFTNGKWYEFPQHTVGCYHGYPIGNPTNEAIINRIKRVFGEPPYELPGYKFCTE
ncbi:hypothetical protein CGH78_21395 [Vibrio parahaemolyticus]|uniref:hypothetical protein n=1 Tax=Vibrio parahaemolyticus TaxID=670 RepID=UPI00111E245D|nr:hypothetical protein [Vibrio parahaemolyticus]TOM31099.1 hypothetical protein CGH78_21395 [Vibrio parahaemolyticus]